MAPPARTGRPSSGRQLTLGAPGRPRICPFLRIRVEGFARLRPLARLAAVTPNKELPAQPDDVEAEDWLPDLSYSQQLYAARPEKLRPKAKRKEVGPEAPLSLPFEPDGRNPAYVSWLEQQSMLHDAIMLGRQLAGHHAMWASPYANPDPRAAVRQASVWFTAYPL